MNKLKKLKMIITFTLVIILLFVFIFIVSLNITNNASKLKYYKMTSDNIPAISYVVGERKVSNLSSKVSNSILYKQYTYYGMNSKIKDIQKYINFLCKKDSYIVIKNLDDNNIKGQVKLSKRSTIDGKEITINIEYDSVSYTISIEKNLN